LQLCLLSRGYRKYAVWEAGYEICHIIPGIVVAQFICFCDNQIAPKAIQCQDIQANAMEFQAINLTIGHYYG
jgi:hypothetical protein